MDNEKQKKEIIIKEITFWKANHLLPEHYCDFLTQLYSGGTDLTEEQEKEMAKQSILKEEKSSFIKMMGLVILVIFTLAMIALMFLFVSNYVWIPTIISIVIFTAVMYFIFKTAKNPTITTTFAYATAALLLFAISVRLTTTFASNNMMAIFLVLLGNCIIWIIVGKLQKQIYFVISGILGLVIIIVYRIIM
ncbi:MAG: hypothetical protein KBT36_12140 [Kurthia sp.]|nr:hypothetical protein [Candidatus Kurthia equi]